MSDGLFQENMNDGSLMQIEKLKVETTYYKQEDQVSDFSYVKQYDKETMEFGIALTKRSSELKRLVGNVRGTLKESSVEVTQKRKLTRKEKIAAENRIAKTKKNLKKYNGLTETMSIYNFLYSDELTKLEQEDYKEDLYKEYMKVNGVEKKEDIPSEVMENIAIMTKLYDHLEPMKDRKGKLIEGSCHYTDEDYRKKYIGKSFDNRSLKIMKKGEHFPNQHMVEEYVRKYQFDDNMTKRFAKEYVKNNYTRALQELNELNAVADYLKKYDVKDMKLGYAKETLIELAEACTKKFKLSESMIKEEVLSEKGIHSEEYRKMDIDYLENDKYIASIFLNISEEKQQAETKQILEETYQSKRKEYLKIDTVERRINEFRELSNLTKENSDIPIGNMRLAFEENEILVAEYQAKIQCYETLLVKKEEKEIAERIQQEVFTLRDKCYKIKKENEVIYSIADKLNKKADLSEEEWDFIRVNTFKTSEELKNHTKGMLQERQLEHKEIVSLTEEVCERMKILCENLKDDMKPAEIVKYQKELYNFESMFEKMKVEDLEPIIQYQRKKILNYAKSARASALFIAANRNLLQESDLTEEEKSIMCADGTFSQEKVMAYAKRVIAEAKMSCAGAFYDYAKIVAPDDLNKKKVDANRQNKKYNKVFDKLASIDATTIKTTYQNLKQKIENDGGTEEDKKELAYLEIYQKLHMEDYLLFGNVIIDGKKKYRGVDRWGDVIVRNYYSFNQYSVFDDMDQDAMFTMLSKMSKGAFEHKNAKEMNSKTVEDYKKINKEGLNQYKSYILNHYIKLYKKYGLEWKDPDFCLQHYNEIEKDFPDTQVHDKILNDLTDTIDFKESKDRLLYALIKFYRSFVSYTRDGVGEYKKQLGGAEAYKEKMWRSYNIHWHFAYLREHEAELNTITQK